MTPETFKQVANLLIGRLRRFVIERAGCGEWFRRYGADYLIRLGAEYGQSRSRYHRDCDDQARRARLVAAPRDGKWMHYRIVTPADPHAERILKEVMSWLKDDKEMRRDRERLVKFCCSPSAPVQLLGAPRPAGVVIEK